MTSLLPLLAGWFPELTWAIPVIGVFVAGAAFVLGRRFLPNRPAATAKPKAEEAEPVFMNGTKVDRRALPRRAGNNVGVLLSDKPPEGKVQGWVLNRSVGGLGLLVAQPLPEGTVIHVQPQAPGRVPPWIAMEVRKCQADSGDWVVNCQFVKTPDYGTLLLFG